MGIASSYSGPCPGPPGSLLKPETWNGRFPSDLLTRPTGCVCVLGTMSPRAGDNEWVTYRQSPSPTLLALPCPTARLPVSNTDKEAEGKWRGMFQKPTATLSRVCRESGLPPTNPWDLLADTNMTCSQIHKTCIACRHVRTGPILFLTRSLVSAVQHTFSKPQ